MTTRDQNLRSAAGLGLAFLVGIAVFAGAFQIASRFYTPRRDPLIPPAQRQPGALAMPLLDSVGGDDPSPGTPATWSLQDQKGKVVVVNYFATWCGPCPAEIPDLAKLAREYASRGVAFAGVALDLDNEQALGKPRQTVLREFAKSTRLPYPILLPPDDSPLRQYTFPIPQTILYDRAGRRALTIILPLDERTLRAYLDDLLNEPS